MCDIVTRVSDPSTTRSRLRRSLIAPRVALHLARPHAPLAHSPHRPCTALTNGSFPLVLTPSRARYAGRPSAPSSARRIRSFAHRDRSFAGPARSLFCPPPAAILFAFSAAISFAPSAARSRPVFPPHFSRINADVGRSLAPLDGTSPLVDPAPCPGFFLPPPFVLTPMPPTIALHPFTPLARSFRPAVTGARLPHGPFGRTLRSRPPSTNPTHAVVYPHRRPAFVRPLAPHRFPTPTRLTRVASYVRVAPRYFRRRRVAFVSTSTPPTLPHPLFAPLHAYVSTPHFRLSGCFAFSPPPSHLPPPASVPRLRLPNTAYLRPHSFAPHSPSPLIPLCL
ncbi:hypothetical protein R3P38DRAFT_3226686 [Favolaschia claudopus]|uniref:Uncharacterized protein n=1 Tax=Favolaschia claudopus TaxID=2862362 RepID=A0AAV9ZTD7_9AGAR